MFKEVSLLIQTPIIAATTGRRIGKVEDFIVQPDSGKILALVAKKKTPFTKMKIISASDIYEFVPGLVVVSSEEAAVEPEEIVRVNEILKQKIKIIGNKVITKSQVYVGKVDDFLIEFPTFYLAKLYVKTNILQDLFKGEIIVPADKIIKITAKAIIVENDVIQKERVKEAKMIREIAT